MSAFTDRITEVLREEFNAHGIELAAFCSMPSTDTFAACVAERVEAELQLREETNTYADYETKAVRGGEGVMRYGGQTSRYVGMKTKHRWVSAWTEVEQ